MNHIEYYDRMTQVQRTGDYEQWISFFLQAFADSAADAIHTIDQLTALHDKNTKLFGTLTKWQRTRVLKVISYFKSPFFPPRYARLSETFYASSP